MIIILLLCCMIVSLIAWSSKKNMPVAPTAAGSIVMALGIFIQGVWQNISGYSPESIWTRGLVIITACIWVYLLINYISSLRNGYFVQEHWTDPVMRFAMGTWVAGTSTLLITIYTSFHIGWIQGSIRLIAILNIGLWLLVLYAMCLGWYQILRQSQIKRVHGTILLSTVSTQSIVLMSSQIYTAEYIASWLNQIIIILGLIFYLFSVGLIVHRYWHDRHRIVQDWTDTNCILYGALAITGVAVHASHVWSTMALIVLWWITFMILLVVELIELIRAGQRIIKKGWRYGIGIYNTVQWTRVFTLGMFYLFTMRLSLLDHPYVKLKWVIGIHHSILNSGAWIISLLLVIEVIFWVRAMFNRYLDTEKPAKV